MLKIVLFSLSVFILTGCQNILPIVNSDTKQKIQKQSPAASQTKVKKPAMRKMFQTVDRRDVILTQSGQNKEHCIICGMNLVKFYKTSHSAKLNGKNTQYCSLHCMTEHINKGAELENPMVVDIDSLKFIPVTEAFYVVGSDVPGTMSPVSKYAFKNLDLAKAFQKKHGGKILDFYSAWQIAKKDFQK
jgi:nitrous oxide reductase accessory protein NosL